MQNIIQKITDIATIVFPSVIAILGVLHLAGAIEIASTVEQITMIALGTASAVASIIYNKVTKKGK